MLLAPPCVHSLEAQQPCSRVIVELGLHSPDPTPEVSELREHSIPLILTLSNLVSITQE